MISVNSLLAQNLNSSEVKEPVELQQMTAKVNEITDPKWISKLETLRKKIDKRTKGKTRREIELDQELKKDLKQAHEMIFKMNSILKSK